MNFESSTILMLNRRLKTMIAKSLINLLIYYYICTHIVILLRTFTYCIIIITIDLYSLILIHSHHFFLLFRTVFFILRHRFILSDSIAFSIQTSRTMQNEIFLTNSYYAELFSDQILLYKTTTISFSFVQDLSLSISSISHFQEFEFNVFPDLGLETLSRKSINSLAVGLGFEQKFKPDPRVDVLSGWTHEIFQSNPRVDVRRVLSSLPETNLMR